MNTLTQKPKVDTILVAKTGTSLLAQGTNFTNAATGKTNLAAGQLGIFNADTNEAIATTATVANTPNIFIAQGRDMSQDKSPLPKRPVEKTTVISPIHGVEFGGDVCAVPLNSTHLIGADHAATSGKVNVVDEELYKIIVGFRGRRSRMINGIKLSTLEGTFTTPDYSVLGLGTDDARDHLLQNLGYNLLVQNSSQFNIMDKNPLVVFALDSDNVGSSSVTVSTLTTPGTTVVIGYTKVGSVLSLEITDSMAATFAGMIANGDLVGTEGVIPFSLNATAVAAGGLGVAGDGTSNVDRLVVMANDAKEAFRDSVPQVKENINVTIPEGFDVSVYSNKVAGGFEGKGTSRQWQLFYERGAAFKFDSTLERFDGRWIGYASDIQPDTYYTAYIVSYNTPNYVSNGTLSYAPERAILLVPCCDEALKNSIETYLNGYLGSSANTRFTGSLNSAVRVEVEDCPL